MDHLLSLVDKAVDRGDVYLDESGILHPTAKGIEEFEKDVQDHRDEKKLKQILPDSLERQERCILASVLNGDEDQSLRWAQFRLKIGLRPSDPIPDFLWTDPTRLRIAHEIDLIFRGKVGEIRRINAKALMAGYQQRVENGQVDGSFVSFNMAVNELGQYIPGDTRGNSYAMAVELLLSAVARRKLETTMSHVSLNQRKDRPVEEILRDGIEGFSEAMKLVRGRLRDSETFLDQADSFDLLRAKRGKTRSTVYPTGIRALDIDLQGGVSPDDPGKCHIIGARSGVGKTTLGVSAAVGLAINGADVLFITAELRDDEIMARANACYGYRKKRLEVPSWFLEGRGSEAAEQEYAEKEIELEALYKSDQERGQFLVKGDFCADAEAIAEYIYAAKSRCPDLAAVFIDHFHILKAGKGFSNRSQEMEHRALTLMQAAKAAEVDVFIMAQLNRDACMAQKPGLEHINGTDVLGQLATAAWFMEYPKENLNNPEANKNQLVIHHGKFRNGQRETVGGDAGKFITEYETKVSVAREYCFFTDGTDA